MKMHVHRHKFETKRVVSPLSGGVSRKMSVEPDISVQNII